MNVQPPSPVKVLRLLARQGWRRLSRRWALQIAIRRAKRKAAAGRQSTRRVNTPGQVWSILMGLLMMASVAGVSYQFCLALCLQERPDSAGRIGIDRYTYEQMLSFEKLCATSKPADSSTRPTSQTEFDSTDLRMEINPVPATSPTNPQARLIAQRGLVHSLLQIEGQDRMMRNLEPGSLSTKVEQECQKLKDQFDRLGSAGFFIKEKKPFAMHLSVDDAPAVAWMLQIIALGLLLFFFGMQNQDLGKVGWNMEWLFSFPIESRVLLGARIMERTLACSGWIIIWPFLSTVLWIAGLGAWGILVAAAATIYINLLMACAELLIETWLRRRFSLAAIKNFQALFSIVATAMMLIVYVPFAHAKLAHFARALPGIWREVPMWLPAGLPAVFVTGAGQALPAVLTIIVCGVVAFVAATECSHRMILPGLISQTGPLQGRRGREAQPARRMPVLRGIIGKELRLLLRDRNFFAQAIIVPAMIVLMQYFLNRGHMAAISNDFRHVAAMAFATSGYVQLFGASRVLVAEGSTLWLLYTFPRSLHELLRRKARLWGVVGACFTLAVLAAGWAGSPTPTWQKAIFCAVALGEAWIFSLIAAALGTLGTNAFEEDIQRKLKTGMVASQMAVLAIMTGSFYVPTWLQSVAMLVLCLVLCKALWDKVADRIAYLLEPAERPPPAISLSDALTAAFAFFALQVFGFILLRHGIQLDVDVSVVLSYLLAAVIAVAATQLVFRMRGIAPTIIPKATLRSILSGLAWAAPAIIAAVAYLALVHQVPAFRTWLEQTQDIIGSLKPGSIYLAVLAVIIAPPLEEYIFRGLVLKGMLRRMKPPTAIVASAALFAAVHPSISIIPVFGLGLATAIAYHRTGRLAAPIAAHMLYNAAAIAASMWIGNLPVR